jgi:putative tricarboxylic transport membrane protein
MFEPLFEALNVILLPQNVIAMVLGTIGGIMFGAMPGLTGSTGISMLIPLTFGMNPLVAMAAMAGIHNGGSYGGAIPAILLRIPGTPGAIVTTFDGYPMSQQGHTARALKLAALSSAVGGMISALALMLLAPPLVEVALAFGPGEIFWLCFFGLSSIAVLLSDDPLKGLLAACFGVMVSLIGQDFANGYERYSFDFIELADGIPLLVIMVGMYALTPCWGMGEKAIKTGIGRENLNFSGTDKMADWPWRGILFGWLRSIPLGMVIGILPGVGGLAAGFIAYNAAKASAKDPDSFGKGNPVGVAIAESANNADNAAAMVPALTLGIPGSGAAALVLGGLMVHGLQPGTDLFQEAPNVVFGYMWAMFITSGLIIVFGGIIGTRIFANVLLIPQVVLMPLIVCVCVVGIYSFRNDVADAYIMFIFGFIGYAFHRLDFPIAPVILGLVLGDKAEFNFRTALKIGFGDWTVLFSSTISVILASLVFLVLIYPAIRAIRNRKQNNKDSS